MQDLNEKRAVITCDSQGLGLAMVEALASCGGNVTAIGRIVGWAEYGGLLSVYLQPRLNRIKEFAEGSK
jgi:NAD(P)-dependent dehydrogenase (short-subunit alcohol dehydrogenase family)